MASAAPLSASARQRAHTPDGRAWVRGTACRRVPQWTATGERQPPRPPVTPAAAPACRPTEGGGATTHGGRVPRFVTLRCCCVGGGRQQVRWAARSGLAPNPVGLVLPSGGVGLGRGDFNGRDTRSAAGAGDEEVNGVGDESAEAGSGGGRGARPPLRIVAGGWLKVARGSGGSRGGSDGRRQR